MKKRQRKKNLKKKELKKIIFIDVMAKIYENFQESKIPNATPNFQYTISVKGVEISLLDINGTIVTPIKSSDKVYSDTGKPFYMQVNAILKSPSGSGSIQLKFLDKNKDVFDAPKEFEFGNTGTGGLFLSNVTLP